MPDRDQGVDAMVFRSAAEFDGWLADHHGDRAGVWLQLAKASTGITSMNSDEAVDVGLCWGWISGQRRSLDGDWYLQRYVPRRPRSRWSQVNVAKVEVLRAAGRMRPPGLAKVDAAMVDGRWGAAYPSQRDFTVPDDLRDALADSPAAGTAFAALTRTEQYLHVLKLLTAPTATARAGHLRRIVDSLDPRRSDAESPTQ